jgi:tetratricopeptide (TPR) repeat protein
MYDAFISYRRSDGAPVARWLRRELQGFRPPRALRGRFGHKLAIYLDTAYERGASDFYEQSIRPALLSSRYLIVIATPNAVRLAANVDDWIAREIAEFSAGPNAANVIAVRGAGEFDDPLPADLNRRFPNIEIVDLRGAGRLWFVNPSRAARLIAEKLKIIAPLLDLPLEEMPRLRQEDEKRQQGRLGTIAGATAGALVAVSALSIVALQNSNRATRALEDSMFSTGSMVLQSKRLPDDGEGQTTRRYLINQGCDLIDKLSRGSGRAPQIAELVACKLERARQHEELKEFDEARRLLQEAVTESTARYAQIARSDAGLQILESRQALVAYLDRQDDRDGARAEYRMLLADARRLRGDLGHSFEIARAVGETLGQLGELWRSRGEGARAAESYAAAATAVRDVIELQGETTPQAVEWLTKLHHLAGEQLFDMSDFKSASDEFQRSLEAAARVQGDSSTVEYETAWAQATAFQLKKQQGDAAGAEGSRAQALASIDTLMRSDSLSDDLKAGAERLRKWLDEQARGKARGT